MKSPVMAVTATNPSVFIHNGKAITTSIAIAEYFQKTHDNVLKKIRSIIAECDDEYRLVNFNETSYLRENPNGGDGIATVMYELTRDAFVLIAMGFTGKKALQWKINYINAFNRMEAELYGTKITSGVTQEEKDAYNINALAKHYEAIYQIWKEELRHALKMLNSPIYGRLCDRFHDGYAFLKYLQKDLNNKLTGNKTPRLY